MAQTYNKGKVSDMADPTCDNSGEGVKVMKSEDALEGRKLSWGKLRRIDSLNLEAGRISNIQTHGAQMGWSRTLFLAFQSLGVVYGDIGTSPLYVYASTFPNGIKETEDLLGVLSLILYTLILIPLLKYVLIVLWANDNGDGGTFALYSLISRYANVSLIPNQQAEDAMVSNYKLETPSTRMKRAQWVKEKLEGSTVAKVVLFFITILGTSMVLGDGVLTPSISVLSAVSGIKEKASSLTQGNIVIISIAILIMLFSVQRFGTEKVGYSFAPIIVIWFSFIGGTGLYNLFKYDLGILRAFNPKYIIDYFKRNGKQGWISLGGVVLAITGTEAMFADLGHFSVRAIQISFCFLLLPAVSLAYIGQAAYLTKFPEEVADAFYKSIPNVLFWPTFIVAVSASIIASQAMISGAYAIISQSQALGCFPRVRVFHTSAKYEGQVYIPEINYALMIACVIVTAGFKTTVKIGNAYGIAVVSVMLMTTSMVTLIMIVIWKADIWLIILFFSVFVAIETLYISATLYKFVDGGYLPLVFSFFMMLIMGIWHYVHVKRYKFELKHTVSRDYMTQLAVKQDVRRIPGVGFLYSELVQGIPPIFRHFVEKIPSIHSVLVFVSLKHLPISRVEMEERFLFRQIGPRDYRMFRCVVRYGYNDVMEETKEFEVLLIEQLKQFIHHEYLFLESGPAKQSDPLLEAENLASSELETSETKPQRSGSSTVHVEETLKPQSSPNDSSRSIHYGISKCSTNSSGRNTVAQIPSVEEEKQFVQREMENGVVYLLAEAEVVAENNSSIVKKLVVNYIYNFIRRNIRQGEKALSIPRGKLLKVKCWQIRWQTKAPQATGTIHSDFEKDFICAKVMKFEELKELGSEAIVKAAGKYRQEGKTYVVQDGDIIFFKFNISGGGNK